MSDRPKYNRGLFDLISEKQQLAWLDRSRDWAGLDYKDGWRAQRVLGGGNYGIAGLWYNDRNLGVDDRGRRKRQRRTWIYSNNPNRQPRQVYIPKYVVVKQGKPGEQHMEVRVLIE